MVKRFFYFKTWLWAAALGVCGTTAAAETGPLVSYSFEMSGQTDDSGTYPFKLVDGAMVLSTDDGNRVLSTGTANGYLDLGAALGADVLSSLNGDYTISLDLCIGQDNALDSYAWAWAFTDGTDRYLGLVNAAGNGDWYYEIKDGSAQSVHSYCGLSADEWHTVTVVQQDGTCTYYLDGEAVGTYALTLQPSDFASSLQDNYLGRSPFAADAYMQNTLMDNFRVYGHALTADEVAGLYDARPASATVVMGVADMLEVDRNDLYLAQAARYIHRQLELPTACTYGTVEWEFTPNGDNSVQFTYADGVFTVESRTDQPVAVGELNGRITYDGTTCMLFDEPVTVTVAPDDEAYGYLYCHMPNLVPQTGEGTLVSQVITYALGTEEDLGLVFNELNRGASIIDGIGTELPWCRDAFMAKDKKRKCYYIVTTDLYGSRDGGTSMLENYSIGMFRSYDLINWTYTRCDMKEYLSANPVTDIYDNTGTQLLTADKVSRVWAPQVIFLDGDPYIYYAMGNTDNGDCDHFYISKANEDFTGITSFQMLYGANRQDNVLDADINYLETDGLYHMSYRDYAAGGILDITTEDLLNPEWSTPVSSFQDGNGYEASSVFRRINDDVWNVGNVNYGDNIGYHFHTADALLRNLQTAPDMSGHLSPQHGSFVHVTQTEYELLQTWSDLKALIADGSTLALSAPDGGEALNALIEKAEGDITADRGAETDLSALLALLQEDFVRLRARVRLERALAEARAANLCGDEGREGLMDAHYNDGKLTAALSDALEAGEGDDEALWATSATALSEATASYFRTLVGRGTAVEVRNGTFDNGTTRWTVNGTVNTSDGVAEFFALRTVDYSASIRQVQRSLSEGYYVVKCQAFERNGENDHTGRDCSEGVEQIHYEFVANDAAVPVRSLYELPYEGDGALYGFANTMAAANALFSASEDNYACWLLVYVDGTRINLGLQRTEESTVTSSEWCCFDNFEVYFLDDPTGVGAVETDREKEALPVYDLSGVRRGLTDEEGRLPQHLQKGVYVIENRKVLKP